MEVRFCSSRDRTDYDVIRENHKFLWDDEEDTDLGWERKLAKKYWNKLYKEYTICDLSRYKENKIAFRWRVEKEVEICKFILPCCCIFFYQ